MLQGGGDDDEDDFEIDGAGPGATDALPAGGFAARRAKRARAEAERAKLDSDSDGDSEGGSDSEDGDSEDGSSDGEGEEEEDGLTALERRRRAQAAGSHPLQESFRELAAKLMSKHGIAPDAEGGSEGEEGTESGSDEDDDEGDSEGGESSSGEEADGSEDSDSEREPEAAPAEADVVGKGAAVAGGTLTFTPPLPETYQAFSAMVEGLSADDLGEMVARIRAFNAAALATEGRKRMQVFYGCLMQHFVTLAAATPPEMAHLDALVPHIFALTSHVPFYAATLARTRLTKAHKQLAQRLRDPVLKAQAWPAPRVLLLLRLFTVLYPVSDKRHPVLTPASLLATSALTLCPLARPRDVATGLFLASLVVHMHAEAKRFAPEPLNFAVELLHSAVPGRLTEDGDPAPQWLSLGAEQQKGLAKTVASIEPLSIDGVLGADDSDAYFSSAEFKSAAAVAAIRLVGRMAEVLSDIDALPEVMAPAQEALKAVASMAHAPQANGKTPKSKKSPANTSQTVAPAVAALAVEVLSQVDAAVEAARSRRRPLFNRALVAVPEKKQYNPRYEDGFATGKDYDPDRERAERKRLQRELRREERGAARELRKDAAFMAGVRDKEKAQAQGELDASARRAMAFLQKQESDFKSGGQGGMWKKKKKK